MLALAVAKTQFAYYSAVVRVLTIVIAAAAAALIAVGAVLTLKRLKMPFNPKVLLRVGVVLAVGAGVNPLFSATGAFGLAYYAPAPSNVEGMEITPPYSERLPYSRNLIFSDEDDIRRFQELEREFLKENKSYIMSASSSNYIHSIVSYTLKNGKRFERYYTIRPEIYAYDADKVLELDSEFAMCFRSLPGYPALVADCLKSDTARGCAVELGEDTLNVSADKTNEFVELCIKDIAENYSVDDNVTGTVVFYPDDSPNESYSLPITDKMTSVTAFLNDSENFSKENAANPELYLVTISFSYNDFGVEKGAMSVEIHQNDLDTMCVKNFLNIYENYSGSNEYVKNAANISVIDIKTGEDREISRDKLAEAASMVFEMEKILPN